MNDNASAAGEGAGMSEAEHIAKRRCKHSLFRQVWIGASS